MFYRKHVTLVCNLKPELITAENFFIANNSPTDSKKLYNKKKKKGINGFYNKYLFYLNICEINKIGKNQKKKKNK